MDVDGHNYEAGGTIIHPRNQYMVEFSKLLGLDLREPQSSKLALYNGKNFIFEESDWYFITIAKLLWHYGFSLLNLFKDVRSMLDDFSRIYRLQDKGYAYTTVSLLLNSMNPSFPNMTQTTLYNILLKNGYSQKILDELVQSIMLVNYGQTNNITGFAGYVSVAGAENNLWSVEGGNKLIPEGLLKISGADFIQSNVIEIELLPKGKFSVKYKASSSDEVIKSSDFDFIILSAPLIKGKTNIKFVNFTTDFRQFEHAYHQTVTTFIKGTLNPSAFNTNYVPDIILTNNEDLPFNSIAKCYPVDNVLVRGNKNVYKIFSQQPLGKESITKLFKNVDIIKEKIWMAYPHYKSPEDLLPFILHPGLYYINAIEISASAMEMSAISAKNIALLIFNSWKNTLNKIDSPTIPLKDEF